MKKLFLTAATLVALATPAAAHAQTLGHNGSLMDMRVDQRTGEFSIVYARPKDSLLAIGVTPGVLLIKGRMNRPPYGPPVEAIAHVYDPQCGAMPYRVTGSYDANARTLEGPAPVVWAGTCRVAEYRWTKNSYLRFDLLRSAAEASPLPSPMPQQPPPPPPAVVRPMPAPTPAPMPVVPEPPVFRSIPEPPVARSAPEPTEQQVMVAFGIALMMSFDECGGYLLPTQKEAIKRTNREMGPLVAKFYEKTSASSCDEIKKAYMALLEEMAK
jgi:hypothetical protein